MGRTALLPILALLAISCQSATTPSTSRWSSLRTERDLAVRAGLRWLDTYLADEAKAAALGVDAVAIFADYAASTADEASRPFALSAARRHARDLEMQYLAFETLAAGELLDAILLVTQLRELGLDATALRAATVRGIEDLPDPDHVYGLRSLAPEDLDRLPEDELFDLLLGVYAVERGAAMGDDFGITFGLEELLPVLRRRPLMLRAEDPDPTGELFRTHVFRATHVVYVLTDYGRLRQREEDAPATLAYLRRVFPDALAARDVELVAEIVDVWRCLGRDETDSPLVREGTVFLLETQNEDGSWGPGAELEDPYEAAHHTWCAIMGLGERRVLRNTPYERRLREILRREIDR
jgi:hypothetical protein